MNKMDEMIDDVESLLNLLIETGEEFGHVRKIDLEYKQAGEYPGQLVLPEIEIVFDS